jgi:hypothetical protein
MNPVSLGNVQEALLLPLWGGTAVEIGGFGAPRVEPQGVYS